MLPRYHIPVFCGFRKMFDHLDTDIFSQFGGAGWLRLAGYLAQIQNIVFYIPVQTVNPCLTQNTFHLFSHKPQFLFFFLDISDIGADTEIDNSVRSFTDISCIQAYPNRRFTGHRDTGDILKAFSVENCLFQPLLQAFRSVSRRVFTDPGCKHGSVCRLCIGPAAE